MSDCITSTLMIINYAKGCDKILYHDFVNNEQYIKYRISKSKKIYITRLLIIYENNEFIGLYSRNRLDCKGKYNYDGLTIIYDYEIDNNYYYFYLHSEANKNLIASNKENLRHPYVQGCLNNSEYSNKTRQCPGIYFKYM